MDKFKFTAALSVVLSAFGMFAPIDLFAVPPTNPIEDTSSIDSQWADERFINQILASAPGAAVPAPAPVVAAPRIALPSVAPGHSAEWAGPQPYILEPPDLLDIRVMWPKRASIAEFMSRSDNYYAEPSQPTPPLDGVLGTQIIGPDGKVNLNEFGTVYVAGLPIDSAQAAIQRKIAEKLPTAEVSVDILGYNSKKFYVVLQGGDRGDHVVQCRCTGRETVLDALAQIGGPSECAGLEIWLSRPSANGVGGEQNLPIDLDAICQGGSQATNYELQPSDRIFVKHTPPLPGLSTYGDSPQLPPTPAHLVVSDFGPPAPTWTEIEDAIGLDEVPTEFHLDELAAAPASAPQGPPMPPSAIAPSAPHQQASFVTPAPVSQVKFDISVIEDVSGSLSEFEPLREQPGFLIGESTALEGTIRILKKHRLVHTLSEPSLVTPVGRQVMFKVGSHSPDGGDVFTGLQVEVLAREIAGGMIVDFKYDNTLIPRPVKLSTTLFIPHGYTVVMQQPPAPDSSIEPSTSERQQRIYIALTPTVVK